MLHLRFITIFTKLEADMKKMFLSASAALLVLMASGVIYAGVCPQATDIQYINGQYVPPVGWTLLYALQDGGVSKWIETSWGGLKAPYGHRIQCVYETKRCPVGSCGISLIKSADSTDPWTVQSHTNWVDQKSHVLDPYHPWSFCQNDSSYPNVTRDVCVFPDK